MGHVTSTWQMVDILSLSFFVVSWVEAVGNGTKTEYTSLQGNKQMRVNRNQRGGFCLLIKVYSLSGCERIYFIDILCCGPLLSRSFLILRNIDWKHIICGGASWGTLCTSISCMKYILHLALFNTVKNVRAECFSEKISLFSRIFLFDSWMILRIYFCQGLEISFPGYLRYRKPSVKLSNKVLQCTLIL